MHSNEHHGQPDGTGRLQPFQKVGVVGLGLIGGSLAKAMHLRAGLPVVGLDCSQATLDAALQDGTLAAGALIGRNVVEPPEAGWQLLQDCDLVFICTPAETVPDTVNQAARSCRALITDVASVKGPVMEHVTTDRFIGGHPMAGSERHGYTHASDALLENAVYVLCVRPGSQLPVSQVQRLEQLIRQIGATPVQMDAAEHDLAVAAVSHLPHVAASALSLLAALTDQGSLTRLAAGGFRDITRIASSDPDLWAGISLESRPMLLPLLHQYTRLIDDFAQALATGDQTTVRRFFHQAAQYRNALPVDGRGALAAHSALTVYVSDRPGVLGHITTMLGEHGINISNIRIRELRAYEGGCLQLLLPDASQAVKAAWLLKEAGYVCD